MKSLDKPRSIEEELGIDMNEIPLYEDEDDYIDESAILSKDKKKRLYPAS